MSKITLEAEKIIKKAGFDVDFLMRAPFSFYSYNAQLELVAYNDFCANTISKEDANYLGKQLTEFIQYPKITQPLIAHNQKVLESKKLQLCYETGIFNGISGIPFFSIKIPYFRHKKAIGFCGISFPINHGYTLSSLFINQQLSMLYEHEACPAGISEREQDCLIALAHGFTVKEIATRLCITPRTVLFHLENLKSKLNASSRSKLIQKAIEIGLLNITIIK